MARHFIFFITSLFCTSAFSCFNTDPALAELKRNIQITLGSENIQGDIDFLIIPPNCKIWPSQNGKSVLLQPYGHTKKIGESEENYLGMAIAIVNSKTGAIESLVNETKIVTIDAIEPKSLSIDTATYRISPEEIAFGVRIFQQNQSRANPFQEEFINLYVPKNQKIEKVVSGLVTSTYNGEGDGFCGFKGENKYSTIAISPKIKNKKNKLIVTIKTKEILAYDKQGACIELNKYINSRKFTIQYNGKQYEIPTELKSISTTY
ncbi:hypothetical protein IB229_09870 [Pseudomonas sp. PDM14]|uniref:hypothetical protein n=1 Tax=Pseudomonas sp. PDM14 TaxID=2769288 RepID=UPI001786F251|nr:hypothetical protein [Pseudomonas sp. PDM14]MBD9483280.1 hypothetical protein [Pseudomonas sp. PDM14]